MKTVMDISRDTRQIKRIIEDVKAKNTLRKGEKIGKIPKYLEAMMYMQEKEHQDT